MTSAASRPLTERQRAVMERIDRRMPIKVIAQELGVSETRINQHIRALKNIYEAESLGKLVEQYRADNPQDPDSDPDAQVSENADFNSNLKGLSEAAYKKRQVEPKRQLSEAFAGNDPGELVMSDVLPLVDQAP